MVEIASKERQSRIDAWQGYSSSLLLNQRAKVGLLLAEMTKATPKDDDVLVALLELHGADARVLVRRIG